MSDVACIAMEHEDCDITTSVGRGSADVEGGERFPIWRGYHEVFEVVEAKLGGAGYIGTGEIGDVGGVDEGSVCSFR